jgi:fused signal recognition particle receptor
MLGWFKKTFSSGSKAEDVEIVEDKDEVEAPSEEGVSEPEEREEPKSILHEDVGVLFKRLTKKMSKTRGSLIKKVDELFLGKKVIDPELLDDLEEILITADIGTETTMELVDDAREKLARNELSDPLVLRSTLQEKITEYLISSDKPAELVMPDHGPFVIMVVGVNGVGKTTTIGKIANKFVNDGQKVLLVAADTFRAAAVEQLQIWGQRIGVPVIAQDTGADPSAVVFDGLEYAEKRDFDVIIIDTAGRLHTKVNLMEELKKINRVIGKKIPAAPHEVMLVLDATTGQNGISQTRAFSETVEVTGLALTKLDGTAKGGIVVNICREFDIPIRFIGIGEQVDDLRDFDPAEFAKALFYEGE